MMERWRNVVNIELKDILGFLDSCKEQLSLSSHQSYFVPSRSLLAAGGGGLDRERRETISHFSSASELIEGINHQAESIIHLHNVELSGGPLVDGSNSNRQKSLQSLSSLSHSLCELLLHPEFKALKMMTPGLFDACGAAAERNLLYKLLVTACPIERMELLATLYTRKEKKSGHR